MANINKTTRSKVTPIERYQHNIDHSGFQYDATQAMAVQKLDDLYHRLIAAHNTKSSFGRFKSLVGLSAKKTPEKGLYFWGGVGRGKTYIMDVFYDALPFEQKMRTHFHRFMKMVHEELEVHKGKKNPLELIANDLGKKYKVLCFDEFFVSDIADAMILGGLLQLLFERGVSLVTTSNIVPSGLYKDGLQRQRFLPAIKMLEEFTEVLNVDGGIDYRLRTLEQATLYHYPLSSEAENSLNDSFNALAPDDQHIVEQASVNILGRDLIAKKECDDVIWFEFLEVCDGPRSQNDYIELATMYHTVLLSNLPQFTNKNDDQARRFINLVDEFYDRRIKLLISAQVSITELYESGRLTFEFERTQSRLLEMQSHDYLASEHVAS